MQGKQYINSLSDEIIVNWKQYVFQGYFNYMMIAYP